MNSTIIYHPAIKSANVAGFSGDVQVVEGDLRDRPTVERVFTEGKFDTVIHLAARAGMRPSIENSCKLPGKLPFVVLAGAGNGASGWNVIRNSRLKTGPSTR